MNVDELQMHLSNVAQLLRDAKGTKAADVLAELCQRLQPYRDRRLKDVMDLLDKAEEIVRTGALPARGKARKGKADPQAIQEACNRVVELYQRAKDPSTTSEAIQSAFAVLEQLDLPVGQLEVVARQLDIGRKIKPKPALLSAMKAAVVDRKGAYGRVQV